MWLQCDLLKVPAVPKAQQQNSNCRYLEQRHDPGMTTTWSDVLTRRCIPSHHRRCGSREMLSDVTHKGKSYIGRQRVQTISWSPGQHRPTCGQHFKQDRWSAKRKMSEERMQDGSALWRGHSSSCWRHMRQGKSICGWLKAAGIQPNSFRKDLMMVDTLGHRGGCWLELMARKVSDERTKGRDTLSAYHCGE